MSDLFVDFDNGSDTAGNGSEANPFKTYRKATSTQANNVPNSIRLRRGQVHPFTQTEAMRNGLNASARGYLGAYGYGPKPRVVPAWVGGWTSLMWQVQGSQFVTWEDVIFDAQRSSLCPSVASIQVSGAANINDVFIHGCEFTGASVGAGLSAGCTGGTANAGYAVKGLVVARSDAYNNATPGFGCGGEGSVWVNNRAWGNGWGNGAHGFTSGYGGVGVSTLTGWALVSGTIYSQASALEAWACITDDPAQRCLRKNVLTPTTPAVGEFGWSAGVIYVNTGASPAGVKVTWALTRNSPMLIGCEAFGNIAYKPYPYSEGTGIQFDDLTYRGMAIGCLSHDNAGPGFAINQSTGCAVIGSVATRNGRNGFTSQASDDTLFDNIISIQNGNPAKMHSDGTPISSVQAEINLASTRRLRMSNYAIRAGALSNAMVLDAISAAGATVGNGFADFSGALVLGSLPAVQADMNRGIPEMTDSGLPTSSLANLLASGFQTGAFANALCSRRDAPLSSAAAYTNLAAGLAAWAASMGRA